MQPNTRIVEEKKTISKDTTQTCLTLAYSLQQMGQKYLKKASNVPHMKGKDHF